MTGDDGRARIAESHRRIELVTCGQCGAPGAEGALPGMKCRTPAGKVARCPHFARRERAITEGTWVPE